MLVASRLHARKPHAEARALSCACARGFHQSALQVDRALDERETEAQTAGASPLLALHECVENARQHRFDTLAVVLDAARRPFAVRRNADANLLPGRRESDRVI